MSDIEVKVSLKNGVLDVSDGGDGIGVGPHGLQSIAWLLDAKTLAGCHFEPLGPEGGFNWVKTVKQGVFSTPWISADGRRLTLEDTHTGEATRGESIYILRVRKSKSVLYSTTHTLRMKQAPAKGKGKGKGAVKGVRTSNNPVIVNH
jgi:hypothetical protein